MRPEGEEWKQSAIDLSQILEQGRPEPKVYYKISETEDRCLGYIIINSQ